MTKTLHPIVHVRLGSESDLDDFFFNLHDLESDLDYSESDFDYS